MGSSEGDESLESYGTDIGRRTSSFTRVHEWILVDGDRLFVATLISVGVFLFFLLLNEVGFIAVVNDDSITRLAGGMIAGTFSLVTLVVSINQLILSQEFASAGDAREQLEGVMEFRRNVADTAGVPASPGAPSRVLELLVESARAHASGLADAIQTHDDDDVRKLVVEYTEIVEESADRIDDTLEQTKFGTFQAVSAAIGYNSAWQLYLARNIRGRYEESMSDEAASELEALITTLELFDTTREHFKTTYLQKELTRFSQLTIYCGVPAILAAMTLGFVYADLAGPTVSAAFLPYVVSALIAIVISPLALLAAFILRTATVTRRTASVGPMLPQKDPEAGPFDVTDAAESESPGGTATEAD
ncbi:hypothetical protein [Natronolimnohabitans innermongolicus]|uniref:Uncharacterized protein n=1 Tax=Natronolimnohabitans innermongolicus JCM 12255 TaxID=1227499 RepID=L9XBE1_9EURY|nr:hypothetical protein [Natronolimnohabitans innermongolicus]ELY58761.1 hypothetical protein C493_06322 [Natronolimnohabitans innermongolicus JCM 12255]